MEHMEKIGFIGLGIMGKPMAHNLLKAGYPLTFYARRPDVIQEMTAAGAVSVSSPRVVAESTDIVITIVTADPQVREVMLGAEGVLEGVSEGQLIVDMSTISPLTTREIAEIGEKLGVHVMDAPVSGGDLGAKTGTLTIIAGGRKQDFEPGFFLDLKKKDVGIGISMAKAMSVPTPVGAAAYQMYAAASSLGAGKLDFSAVCKAIETLSGVKISEFK